MQSSQVRRLLAVATVAAAAVVCPAHAVVAIPVPTVSSTFDADADGWKYVDILGNAAYTDANILENFPADVTYAGGVISAKDPSSNTFFFNAPGKFLGDKSAYYGGKLTFDVKVDQTDSPWTADSDVVLVSGTTVIVYDFANNPGTDFVSRTVTMTEAGWRMDGNGGVAVTAATFQAVLGNLTAVRLLGEFIASNSATQFETTSLDNVTLAPVPEPSEAMLMAFGIAGLAAVMRRRNRAAGTNR